ALGDIGPGAADAAAAVAVGPAAHIDAGKTGGTYGSQFSAPGHIPGRREFPSGHGGGLQQRGKPDLAVVNTGQFSTSSPESSVSVLLGNGSGSFQPAVTTNVQNTGPGQGNALSLAVGDFNRDGLPDVAVNTAGPAGPAVELLLGKGDGSFQPNHQIPSVGQ